MRKTTRSALLAVALLLYSVNALADVPVRPLIFPADHAGHMTELEEYPDLLEWWYLGGELKSADGRHLAFGAGIFDMKKTLEDGVAAHQYWVLFSVTDVDAEQYYFTMPTGYPASEASISDDQLNINYGNEFIFKKRRCGRGYELKGEAVSVDRTAIGVNLRLIPKAPPLLHSTDEGETLGVVDMRDGGNSYYYSLTDLATLGTVTIGDTVYRVCPRTSTTWLEHLWGDYHPNATHGFNWLTVSLDNGIRGMINVDVAKGTFDDGVEWIEENDPRIVLGGFATFKLPDGTVTYFTLDDTFELNRSNYWQGFSGNIYPLDHILSFPEIDLQLDIQATFDNQDQGGYEGIGIVDATYSGAPVWGTAHLEISP